MSDQIPTIEPERFDVVSIGVSTGGPNQIRQIISQLPADLSIPILVAQHLPPNFTTSLAADLDRASPLTVVHAEDAMPIYPGVVYIGRGRQHIRVAKRGRKSPHLEISEEPTELIYKPSADELFTSCSQIYGGKTLAIIMTGIGRDGTEGAQAVKACGGLVFTQNKESCVVYGMPRSCVEAGLSDGALTPDQIATLLLQFSPSHDLKPTENETNR